MGNKQFVTGLVGIIIGFILGFFATQYIGKERLMLEGNPAAVSAVDESGPLPPDHPPAEVLERLQELQQQAEADPNNQEVRILLGNFYYDIGRFDAAIRWYEEALELDSVNVNVRTDLGTSYLYTRRPDKAIEMYQLSLQIEPEHPQTLQNLGFAYYSIESFEQAIQTWQKLLDSNPDYPFARQIREQMENARENLRNRRS